MCLSLRIEIVSWKLCSIWWICTIWRPLSAAEHSVAKLSGRLFIPDTGPSGSTGTRSYSGVAPRLLMLFCTARGGLRLFGIEVV